MDDESEKEALLEEEIQRFERWATQVRPQLTDPTYESTYQELRLAICILDIKCTIYPTQGDWPYWCNIDITVPEIQKKLD